MVRLPAIVISLCAGTLALGGCGSSAPAAMTPSRLVDYGAKVERFEAANPRIHLPGTTDERVDEYNLLTPPQSSDAARGQAESNLPADALLEGEQQLRSCQRLYFTSAILDRAIPGLKLVMVQLSSTGGGRFDPAAVTELLFLPAAQADRSC